MDNIFQKIVIPVDLSDKTSINSVLKVALNYVEKFNSKLHFVHIIPDFGMKMIEDYLPKYWLQDQKDKYHNKIKELIKNHISEDIQVDFYIGRGAVYDKIIQYANEIRADLIIISAVRPQLKDYMLGPNASKIARHANTSVLVVRESNLIFNLTPRQNR